MLNIMRNFRFVFAIFLFAFTFLASASEKYAIFESQFDAARNEIIEKAVTNSLERRDARIIWRSGLNTKELSAWAEVNSIDVLDVSGTLMIGNREVTVVIPDIGSYSGQIDEVIYRYLSVYFSRFVSDLVTDLENKIQVATNDKEKRNYKEKIDDYLLADLKSISWNSANIISSYRNLQDNFFDPEVEGFLLNSINMAPVIDEFWATSGVKRNVVDIKPRARGRVWRASSETPNLTSASKSSKIFSQFFEGVKGISELAFGAVFPKAMATITPHFCGPNHSSDKTCPPDANWLPTYPAWYGLFSEPEAGHIEGVAHITSKWTATQLASYKNSSLPACNPSITSSLYAVCKSAGGVQSDVIYVQGATFEAESDIPNPACTFRSNIKSQDRQNGCFVPEFIISEMPGAYIDTTLSDPILRFNGAVGTIHPKNLVANVEYQNYLYFDTYGESISAMIAASLVNPVVVRGQVGVVFDAMCWLGWNLCAFALDTTKLGDAIIVAN